MADNSRSVLVVGLGRFGSSVATTLDAMGQDVLAVDKDPELVNRWSSQVPTVQADMTDVLAVEQLNATDFSTAIVAIGDSVEASVITTGNLLDAGISDIWAKSVSKEHARILQRTGARHIINAETRRASGERQLTRLHRDLGRAHRRQDPHAPARGRLQHRGRARARALRHHRGRHQVAGQGIRIRFQGTDHAPQRRAHHHGQGGPDRQVHPRITRHDGSGSPL